MTAQRFHNWLCDARDWAVSRNRYWSVPPARHTAQGCAPPAHWERGLASSGAARRPPAAFHREARLPPAFGGPRLHTQPWVGAGGVGAGARGGGDPSWTFPRACAVQPRHERSGHTTHHAVPPVPALPKVSDPRDVGSQKYRSATRYLLWGGGGGRRVRGCSVSAGDTHAESPHAHVHRLQTGARRCPSGPARTGRRSSSSEACRSWRSSLGRRRVCNSVAVWSMGLPRGQSVVPVR